MTSTAANAPQVKCIFDTRGTSTCQFLVWDKNTRKAAIIDPVMDFNINTGKLSFENAHELLAAVKHEDLTIEYILETHVHADHLTSSQFLQRHLPNHPPVCIGRGITKVQETFKKIYKLSDEDMVCDGSQFDRLLDDEETLPLGDLSITVKHTPGHTPDHLAYLVGDAIFVGDTLFMPDIGSARCDFPGGSAESLYHSVSNKYWSLPPTTRMFVGHDYAPDSRDSKWETTVGEQLEQNLHVKKSVEKHQFVHMRETRDATLGSPKLLHWSLQVNMRAGKFDTNQHGDHVMLVAYPLRIPKSSY
ncbi:beta-lactamase-like protein [Entophlyctis helioformis]|nr:beta-lactamase-like protein [Entophlyctis helioformis]